MIEVGRRDWPSPPRRPDGTGDHTAMTRHSVMAWKGLVGDQIDGPSRQHRVGEADSAASDGNGPHGVQAEFPRDDRRSVVVGVDPHLLQAHDVGTG